MPKRDSFETLSRLCALLKFMAERNDKGASMDEIHENIYGKSSSDAACRRNFNRDCNFLREMLNEKWGGDERSADEPAEIEIRYDRGRKRYFMKGALFFMLPLRLKEEEAYVISSGIKLCKHFIKEYSEIADRLSKKLRNSIPGRVMDAGEGLSDSLTLLMPVSNTESRNPKALEIVLNAVNKKRALKLTDYESMNGETVTDIISPYFLYFKYHSWYVWAASKKNGYTSGPYRLSRMRAIETLENRTGYVDIDDAAKDKMAMDLELDNHPVYGGKEFNVKLRVTGSFVQAAIQTEWFKGQKITRRQDGSVIYSVKLKGLEAITLWIMRSLSDIEVLEPIELRDEIDRRVDAYMERRRLRAPK
jgi:predicted DNA-binding transcriptional regulator YafY